MNSFPTCFVFPFILPLSVTVLCTYVDSDYAAVGNRGIVVCFPVRSTCIHLLQSFKTASGAHLPTHPLQLIRAIFQCRAPIPARQHDSYKPNAAICPQERWGGR